MYHEWNGGRECVRCGDARVDDAATPSLCPGYREPVCSTCDEGRGGRCVDCGRTATEADEERSRLMVATSRGYHGPASNDVFHRAKNLVAQTRLEDAVDARMLCTSASLHGLSRAELLASSGNCLQERLALKVEELAELFDAVGRGDRAAVVDALADIVYLCNGTAAVLGVDMDEALRRVHESNMTKEPGQPKPIKGPDYRPPSFEDL